MRTGPAFGVPVMNLFLDSSVVLAACLSRTGASRLIFESAHTQGWILVVSPWVLREVRVNLVGKENTALTEWVRLRSCLAVESEIAHGLPVPSGARKGNDREAHLWPGAELIIDIAK